MLFKKIQFDTPRVPDLIMDAIVNAIESGQLTVGEDLPSERDMAESLGVGRGSLRECLSILEYLGAIESQGYRKRIIRDAEYIKNVTGLLSSITNFATMEDFINYRRVIEVGIAELACERATKKDLDAMLKAIKKSEKSPDQYKYDLEFHNAVASACHNALLTKTVHLVNNLIADVRLRFWEKPDYLERVLKSHYAIYEAIKSKDSKRAQLEVIHHLDIVKEFTEKYPVED